VGEVVAPFQPHLVEALPLAFPDAQPEVVLGLEAPPGRNVAWVRPGSDPLEVEVVLHTALVTGELRRVLRFGATDAVRDKARAVAFTLAAMVRERDADLRVITPPVAPPAAAPLERPWVLAASVPVGFDVPGFHAGAGLAVHLRRDLVRWLQLGAGVETAFFAGPSAGLIQPAFFAEGAVVLTRRPPDASGVTAALLVGGGVQAAVLTRGDVGLTTWLPLLRLGVEARWSFGSHHGVRFALSTHLTTSTISVDVGGERAGVVGAVWIRPEAGYFVEL
jgi:hypothetical protein